MQSGQTLGRGRSVSGEVGAWVQRYIDEKLSPGDRLPPERELATLLHVSRSSVRQAMRELEQRRRIARTPGRGTTVLEPSATSTELTRHMQTDPQEQVDVADLRRIIEPQIAALAAERATDADLCLLDDALAAWHAGLTARESLEMDTRFHVQLAVAAQNPLLTSLCCLTNDWVHDVRARSHASRAGRRTSVEGHRLILAAVAAGDPAAADEAMRSHLDDVSALVKRVPR